MQDTFEQARAAAVERMRNRESIGRLQEKTLHATLKFLLDPDETHHEVRLPAVGRVVADIFDGERVTEIQNGNFSGFREKLVRLLAHYPVTVVYPLVRRKTLFWIDPETGQLSAGRRSPRVGRLTDALPQLLYIREQLFDPRLTLRLQPVDVEEYRLQDGWGGEGKRGAHRLERVPVALGDSVTVRTAADIRALLPPDLPTPFTAKELGRAIKLTGRNLSYAINILYKLNCIDRVGKRGNSYLYEVSSKPS